MENSVNDDEKRLRDLVRKLTTGKGPTDRVNIRLPATVAPIQMSGPLVFTRQCISLYGGGQLRFSSAGEFTSAVEFRDCNISRFVNPNVYCELPVDVPWFSAVAHRSMEDGPGATTPEISGGRIEVKPLHKGEGNYYCAYFVAQVKGAQRVVHAIIRDTELVYGNGSARPLEFTGCVGGVATNVKIIAKERTTGYAHCISSVGSLGIVVDGCTIDVPPTDPKLEFSGGVRCGGTQTDGDGFWEADLEVRNTTAKGVQRAITLHRGCWRMALHGNNLGTNMARIDVDFGGEIG